jgi:hypothetical protein
MLVTDRAPSRELNVCAVYFIYDTFLSYFTVLDHVDLGGGLAIKNQSIGVASSATGFQDVDGILGCVFSRQLRGRFPKLLSKIA